MKDDTRERLKEDNITEVQESEIEVVMTREETRPRIRRKKDYGDGTTWEKNARKTEAEMDGLCQPRHVSNRNNENMKSMIELVAGIPQLSGSG